MKKYFFGAAILALIFSAIPSCSLFKKEQSLPADGYARKYKSKPVKEPVTVKLSDGLEYTITAKGNGPQVKKGDRVLVFYTGKLTNDTIFDASSRHDNEPYSFHAGMHEAIAGWDSIIVYLHAGDKVTMRIPPKYGYGSRAKGKIPAGSTLIFDIEVLDLPPKPTPWNGAGHDTITTASGLKLIMFATHPENPQPKVGQMVKVHYSGYVQDSVNYFDSSVDRGKPMEFQLGGRVIKGFNEGVALLHTGEKAKVIMPPNLAYGSGGIPGLIPPNATLHFDIELVSFK
jgi:peptidylprolyl isomerase